MGASGPVATHARRGRQRLPGWPATLGALGAIYLALGCETPPAPQAPASAFICSDTEKDRITHRISLWDSSAYYLMLDAHRPGVFASASLNASERESLQKNFQAARFFELPETSRADELDGRSWDLRAASPTRAHRAYNFANPSEPQQRLFNACQLSFERLARSSGSGNLSARSAYQALAAKADSLPDGDARRGWLRAWLRDVGEQLGAAQPPSR